MIYGLSKRDDSNSQTWEWTMEKSSVWTDLLQTVDSLPESLLRIEDSINVLRNDLSDVDSIAQNAESTADKSEEMSQSALEEVEELENSISNAFEEIQDLYDKFIGIRSSLEKLSKDTLGRLEGIESAISQQGAMIANISIDLIKLQFELYSTGQMYNPPEFESSSGEENVKQATEKKSGGKNQE